MDIEELTKSQIVLLVTLVSFVTSMATGIVTVSLMDQAPTSVAQTVNRVIQQTIKEVASPDQTAAVSPVSTKKTTGAKPSDDVAGAIQLASPSIVRLYSSDGTTFLGLGTILDMKGDVVTDIAAVGDAGSVSIMLNGKVAVPASVTIRDTGTGIAFLSMATSSVATSTPVRVPMTLEATPLVLGQTVILISGEINTWVGSGLISSIIPTAAGSTLVKTDISSDNVFYGSPLIDTSGSLVGISTSVSRAVSGSVFEPVTAIRADMSQDTSAK